MPVIVPKGITRQETGILVDWDGAGHVAFFEARRLRLACPCAECVEEMSGRPLLHPQDISVDVRPVTLALVGAYGLRIHWSDGHSTGIYTFERLLADCPCPRCVSPRLV
jgi:ATP-binding protein involved in chromosome partitioning